ncbi:MAG: FliH/SctL family protein [Eubacteriaceae bacterium]
MSKIPLSYKIIKKQNIECDGNSHSIIKTRCEVVKNEIPVNFMSNNDKYIQETQFDTEVIRVQVRKELLQEMEKEKQHIKKAIEEEGQKIKQLAKQEGYKIGFDDGYNKGYAQGLNDANIEAVKIKNQALKIVEQAYREVEEHYINNRKNIIHLAVEMAERITNTTINSSSENIMLLIKPLLQEYGNKENLIIRCHPNNSDFIRGSINDIENLCPKANTIILEDKDLEINGCIVENEHQIVDLQIKKQLEQIKNELEKLE